MKWVATLLLLLPTFAFADNVAFCGGTSIRHGEAPVFEAIYQHPIKLIGGSTFEGALTYIGASEFRGRQPEKLAVASRLVKHFGRAYLGLGIVYSEVDSYNGSRFNFSDVIGMDVTDHVSLRYSHYSNAGLFSGTNVGRDMILLNYRF